MNILRYIVLSLFSVLASSTIFAQTTDGLVAYYSFDDCDASDNIGNAGSNGNIIGQPSCECGVSENALRLDGDDDLIFITGTQVLNRFRTENFSISFYFKPLPNTNPNGVQTLVSKMEDCSNQNAFSIRYSPQTNQITALLSENNDIAHVMSGELDPLRCWQHVAVVRNDLVAELYINGKLVRQASELDRVNITNSQPFFIGASSCPATDTNFEGIIDELRIYSKALTPTEVSSLIFFPDEILTARRANGLKDTVLFLGSSIDVTISETCANTFLWSPNDGVSDITDPNATLTPTNPGSITYGLTFQDDNCVAFDSITINVLDPATLDCAEPFVPNAFTPNGDGLNDDFGIDNAQIFAAGADLLSFDVFDGNGNRIFATQNGFDRWNGNYGNEELNPGVYVYKIRHTCRGEEIQKSGTITLIR